MHFQIGREEVDAEGLKKCDPEGLQTGTNVRQNIAIDLRKAS